MKHIKSINEMSREAKYDYDIVKMYKTSLDKLSKLKATNTVHELIKDLNILSFELMVSSLVPVEQKLVTHYQQQINPIEDEIRDLVKDYSLEQLQDVHSRLFSETVLKFIIKRDIRELDKNTNQIPRLRNNSTREFK